MAVVDVEFIATANFSSLLAQTKMANASLAQLQKTTAAINAEKIAGAFSTFTSSLTNSGRFTSQMVNVTNSTNAFGKSLMAGKLTFAEYKRELSAFVAQREGMIDRLAAQNVRMAESTVIARGINPSTGQAMAQVVTSTGALSTSAATQAAFAAQRIQVLNKVLLQASTSMINWGKNTQWAGRQMMVGLTMPLLVIGGLAAKTYYDFSKELTRFVKVYGNGVSELSAAAVKSMEEQVTGLAMEFQKTLGVAMKQTAELAGLMAQAGYEGEKLTSGMRDVTRLSILGAVDMTTAWKAYQSVQNVFHRTSAQMTDDINFFSGVESTTSLSLQDITASIPKAAPVIRSLGGDIKDLTGYMVAMREGGVPAAEAANTLKTSLARLIAPTRQTKEMFKSFGIDIQGIVQKNAGHLTDMLLALQKALDKLDPTQRAIAIQQAFGKQRFANVTALFNNLYREGSQSAKALEFAGYTAAERAILAAREIYKVQNTDAYKLKRSWGEILVDLSKFGQKFLAVTTKVVHGIGQVFKFFDKFPKAFKEFGMGALIFVAFVGPVVMLTGVIGNFIGSITKGLVHLRMLASGSKNVWAPMTPEMKAAETMAEKFNSALLMQTDNVEVLNTAMKTLVGTLNEVAIAQRAASGPIISPMSTPVGRQVAAHMTSIGAVQSGHSLTEKTGAGPASAIYTGTSKNARDRAYGGGSYSRMAEAESSNQGANKQRSMTFFPNQSPNFRQIDQATVAMSGAFGSVSRGIQEGVHLLSKESILLSKMGPDLLAKASSEALKLGYVTEETENLIMKSLNSLTLSEEETLLLNGKTLSELLDVQAIDVRAYATQNLTRLVEIGKLETDQLVAAINQSSLQWAEAEGYKGKTLSAKALEASSQIYATIIAGTAKVEYAQGMNITAVRQAYEVSLREQAAALGLSAEQIEQSVAFAAARFRRETAASTVVAAKTAKNAVESVQNRINSVIANISADLKTSLAKIEKDVLAARAGRPTQVGGGGRGTVGSADVGAPLLQLRQAQSGIIGYQVPGQQALEAATAKSTAATERRAAAEIELAASEAELTAANELALEAESIDTTSTTDLAEIKKIEEAAVQRNIEARSILDAAIVEDTVAQKELADATFAALPAVDRLAAPAAELAVAQTTLAEASAELALLTEADVGRRAELEAILAAATEEQIAAAQIKAEQDLKSAEVQKDVIAMQIKQILALEGLTNEQKLATLVESGVLTEEQALKLGTKTLTERRILAALSTTGGGGMMGGGKLMGPSMGIGMGMMAGSMFTHGNTQKALMGGSMLAMMAPMLTGLTGLALTATAAIAPIAAVAVGLAFLIKKTNDSKRATQSWSVSSKKSAEELGYTYTNLSERIAMVGDKSEQAQTKVSKLVESLKQAPDDDPMRAIAEDWKDDISTVDTLTKAVNFYYLQLARGVKPEDIKTQISSLLELSQKQGLSKQIDIKLGKINVTDKAQVLTDAINGISLATNKTDNGDTLTNSLKVALGGALDASVAGLVPSWRKSINKFIGKSFTDLVNPIKPESMKTFMDTFTQVIDANKNLSPENWKKFIDGINNSDASKALFSTAQGVEQARLSFLDTLGLADDPNWVKLSKDIKTPGDMANLTAMAAMGMNSALLVALDPSVWSTAVASMNIFSSAIDKNVAAADENLKKLVPHTKGSTAAVGSDPYKAQKDANQTRIDQENKIIKAIEKKKTADQKAFEAKKAQNDYLKKQGDDQISYREALASGDFAAAARVKNEMLNAQQDHRNQLAEDKRQNAYQDQIDTHQGVIDKLNEANKGLDKLTSKSQAAASAIQDQYDTNLATATADMATLTTYMTTHSNASMAQMLADNRTTANEIDKMGLNVGKFFQTARDNVTNALATQTADLKNADANITDAELKLLTNSNEVSTLAAWIKSQHDAGNLPTAQDILNEINHIKHTEHVANVEAERNANPPKTGSSGQQLAQYYVPGHPESWSAYQKGHGLPPRAYPKDVHGSDRGHWIDSGLKTDNGYEYWYFQKYHTGGKITGNSDEVPILAQRGEYMINAKAAKKLGVDRLDIMNTGELPKYHTGGYIEGMGAPSNEFSGSNVAIKNIYGPKPKAAPKTTPAPAPAPATAPATAPTPTRQDDDLSGSGKKHGGIHSVNNAIAFLDGKISSGSSAWTQLCEKLARTAYGLDGMYGSAKLHFEAIPASQRKAVSPAGAKRGMLGFWNTGPYGHIAIADGNGKFYSNLSNGKVGKLKASTINSWNGGHKILGVTNPWWSRGNWIDVVSGHVGGYDRYGNPTVGMPGGRTATYHTGGPVKKLQSDEVEAVLQTGEYVVQRSAVNKIGEDKLNAINSGILPADRDNPYAGLGSPPSDGKEDMPKYGLGAPMSAQSSRVGNVTSAIGFLQKQVRIGSTAWENLCDRLASTAYNMAGKFKSAKTHFNAVPKSHIHGANTASAKRGELGFWDAKPYGHVATADGKGNFYTNTSSGKVAKMSSTRLDKWGKPLGVTDPWWSNNNWISVRNTMPRNMALHEGGPVNKLQSDDVHRVLQAGEYVVQKNAVKRVGLGTLDAINSGQQLATTSNSSYNITVNGVPGMDVNEIASKVVQKIELKEKRKGLARN